MDKPTLTIKHVLTDVNLKKEQELDIYLEDFGYIKIAVSDKGTPIILVDGLKDAIVDEWHGHVPYKKKMTELWDKEHENDDLGYGCCASCSKPLEEEESDDELCSDCLKKQNQRNNGGR